MGDVAIGRGGCAPRGGPEVTKLSFLLSSANFYHQAGEEVETRDDAFQLGEFIRAVAATADNAEPIERGGADAGAKAAVCCTPGAFCPQRAAQFGVRMLRLGGEGVGCGVARHRREKVAEHDQNGQGGVLKSIGKPKTPEALPQKNIQEQDYFGLMSVLRLFVAIFRYTQVVGRNSEIR